MREVPNSVPLLWIHWVGWVRVLWMLLIHKSHKLNSLNEDKQLKHKIMSALSIQLQRGNGVVECAGISQLHRRLPQQAFLPPLSSRLSSSSLSSSSSSLSSSLSFS